MQKSEWLKKCRSRAVRRFGTRVKKHYPVGISYGRLVVTGHIRLKNGCWAVLCACACGGTKTVRYPNQMRRGLVKSCGCLNRELASARWKGKPSIGRLGKGEAAFNALFRVYKVNALKRGFTFSLSIGAFKRLTQLCCAYCGEPPSSTAGTRRNNGFYVFNGIDRVDSKKGYTLHNTVACCKQCNRAKRDLSHAEFLEWIGRLIEHHSSKER